MCSTTAPIDPLVKVEICELFFIRGLYQKNPNNVAAGIKVAELHGWALVPNLEAIIGEIEGTNTITNHRTYIGNSAFDAINNWKPYHKDMLLNGKPVGLFDLFFQYKGVSNHG